MKNLIFVVIVVLVLSISPLTVVACSVGRGFLLPTNYDLVQEVDAIVLAKSIDRSERTDSCGSTAITERVIDFAILEVFKGDVTDKKVTIDGYLGFQGRSEEGNFNGARPGAYSGSCIAMDYRLNYKYLLFLDEFKGEWRIGGAPFSRVNEEVDGMNSPWVKAVQTYIRIGSLNDYEEEKKALRGLLGTDSADSKASEIPGLAEDIKRHFNTPSSHKSFEDNLELYVRAETAKEKSQVLWAYVHGEEEEARPLFQEMLKSDEWQKYVDEVSRYISVMKDKDSFNILMRKFFETKEWRHGRWMMLVTIVELAESEDIPLMLDILRSANKEEVGILAPWFVKYPSIEATSIIRDMVNKEYKKKWKLAFKLAGFGDRDVLEWGKDVLSSDKDRWMGCYIIALSPLPEADVYAKEIISQKDPKVLRYLVEGYEDSADPNKWDRLADIIQLRSEDKDLNYWLETTLSKMADNGQTKAHEYLKLLKRKAN